MKRLTSFPRSIRSAVGLTQCALFAVLLGPSFGGVTACETSCSVDDDPVPTVIEDGIIDREAGIYASSSFFNADWLEFPPKRRYEFRHGLGRTPMTILSWVSFHKRPFPPDKYGNAAESAGNIVILEGATPEYVRVRNDTCETFYLRLEASNPEPEALDTLTTGGEAGGANANSEGGAGGFE